MEWMLLPLKRYATFRGRSRRKEFRMFALFMILASVVLSIVDTVLRLGGAGRLSETHGVGGFGAAAVASTGVLSGLFSLAMLIPNLAVSVRRLHDTDRSGWWLLLPVGLYIGGAVMLIGGLFGGIGATLVLVGGVVMFAGAASAIALLVFFCLDGTSGLNRFGPDPKDPGADLSTVFS